LGGVLGGSAAAGARSSVSGSAVAKPIGPAPGLSRPGSSSAIPFGSGVVGGGIPSFDLGLPDINTNVPAGASATAGSGYLVSPVSPVLGPLGAVAGNNQSFFEQPMMFFSPADLLADDPLESGDPSSDQ
jgi:hypothetical protein